MGEQDKAGDEYLKPSEVARILHVSPKTVDRWANEGRIACIVTLGGHRRFLRSDVITVAEQMVCRGATNASSD